MFPKSDAYSLQPAQRFLRVSLLVAAVLFLLLLGLHAWVGDPDDPDFLYLVPIAVAAGAGGLAYGLGAASLAFALCIAWAAAKGLDLDALGLASRAAAFYLIGCGTGYLAQRLRAASDRMRVLIDSAPDGILELDRTGRIIAVNSAVEKQFGYPRQELLGAPVEILLPRQKKPESSAAGVLDGRRRNGTRIPVELKLGTRGAVAVLILRDVSERERAEEALRKSEERFRTSLDTMLDCFGIYTAVRDAKGEIVDFYCEYLNEAAGETSRLAREEQVGRRLSEFIPRYLGGQVFRGHKRLVETGEPLVVEDYASPSAWSSRAGTMTSSTCVRSSCGTASPRRGAT
jgi:PAS domain S-box-containing protein